MASEDLLELVREDPDAARSLAEKAEDEFASFIHRVLAEAEGEDDGSAS